MITATGESNSESNSTFEASQSVRFSYVGPEHSLFRRSLVRGIEKLTGQKRIEKLYRSWTKAPSPGENLFSAGVRLLELEIDTNAQGWRDIPRKGPLLVVANHPFGVVDGLVLGHLLLAQRSDTKLMTHSLLCQAPQARDYVLPVDFGTTEQARITSVNTRKQALEWLQAGHCLAIFASGSVATSQKPLAGPALEVAWHPFVAKLARIANLRILPVHFAGQNSRLFHIVSHVYYPLRIALLFRETARMIGKRVKVSAGATINSATLPHDKGRDAVLAELRRRTFELGGTDNPSINKHFVWPKHITWN